MQTDVPLPRDEVSTLSTNSDDRVIDIHGKGLKHNAITTTHEKYQVVTWVEKSMVHIDKHPQSESPLSTTCSLGFNRIVVVTQVVQIMQIPVGDVVNVIGVGWANIGCMSGAIFTVQESNISRKTIKVEIRGTLSQVQATQQLIQARDSFIFFFYKAKTAPGRASFKPVKQFRRAKIHSKEFQLKRDLNTNAFSVDSKQMKNYFDELKSKYRAWVSLKNKYDPSTDMFYLTDKEWETEIKKNKCIETLRNVPLLFPDLCALLFDGAISTAFFQTGVDQHLTGLKPGNGFFFFFERICVHFSYLFVLSTYTALEMGPGLQSVFL
ncbi:unnamed protein product [Lactuca saligna]|uniref:Uncharacterized protein n=1 Tax=Lactuca saligna TaxID=75948 RepID=A0AA35ZL97_LACSI|nr:unnamed protein product [Lactuca saligna]